MPCDRATAVRRLTNRYHEQCKRFPRMREIPLEGYVRANLRCVMHGDLLKDYESEDLVAP